MTQYLVGYLRTHASPSALDEVLRVAGEERSYAQLCDPATWSSYQEFRRLCEATSTVLGGDRTLFVAAASAWDSWSTPEITGILQALGSPGALFADIGLSAAGLSTIVVADGEETGPSAWLITSHMKDGFEPFPAFCCFSAGLFSITPKIFGFPAAAVTEVACQCDGAPACRFRIEWDGSDEQAQRAEYFETKSQVLEARLEALQRTLIDLVSSDSLEEVLARIVASAARAVLAPWFILAIDALPSAAQRVYAQGLDEPEAARLAAGLLAGTGPQTNRLVVDVASTRRRYGRLAAMRPDSDRFMPQELVILGAFGRLAAAALDSATALDESRRQATTAQVLLELSTSLAETESTDDMADKVARAVPAVVDCDRAVVVLYEPETLTASIRGTFGYEPELEARLRAWSLGGLPAGVEARAPYCPDIASDEFLSRFATITGSIAATTSPIMANGELIGWVSATVTHHPERLAGPDVPERLRALACQAAAAISNARLLDEIRHRALHDGLTGLANRTLIVDRVEQMLNRARRQHVPAAALFIDLDGFKDVNDTLGHGAGDDLLRAVAGRLSALLRESDTIGRMGGDEFVVLVEGVSRDADPEVVAQRLLEGLREPFSLDGRSVRPLAVSASIGIAMGERRSASDLLRDADVALYAAKASGKNRYVVFEPEMQIAVQERMALELDLRAALAGDQFFLVYQPIIDLVACNVIGVEALLRWRHPTRGVVQPDNFIPVLEETGMIIDIGRWVLTEACRQAALWGARGRHLDISVNVSARQLEFDHFVADVESALADSGLDPSTLVIEVTETAIMRDASATACRLRDIKRLGVRVAIDDFGTGYSSMAYLSQFPVDSLKIDRSFISGLAASPEAGPLIHTLVQLGQSLGLETVAEGIEDEDQLHFLRAQRCDRAQGYFFSRPLDPAALDAFLDVASQDPTRVPGTRLSLALTPLPALAHAPAHTDEPIPYRALRAGVGPRPISPPSALSRTPSSRR